MSGTSATAGEESRLLAVYLSDSLERLAALGNVQPGLSFRDGAVVIGRHTIGITPTSEQAGEMQGKFLSAARFEVTLNGRREETLTFGALGIGDSAKDARAAAVEEWYMTFGAALFQATAARPSALTKDGWSIYPGATGLRGKANDGWIDGTEAMHGILLGALAGFLPKPDAEMHTFDIKLSVNPTGLIEGECRFDGKPSSEVVAALKRLSWPPTGTGYLFKQAYVLAVAGPVVWQG